MKRMRTINAFIASLFALVLLIAVAGGRIVLPALAAEPQYTNVLDDLKKDGAFDQSAYPENPQDHAVQVVQIAESADGELFVYTYQPCQRTAPLMATCVNMSETPSADGTKLYNLRLVSRSGVFGKYALIGFTVREEPIRYYTIASIYREWLKGIDREPTGDNEVSEVSFEVGKRFSATTNDDGTVRYDCEKYGVIEITEKFVGYIRYTDGFKMDWWDVGWNSTDSHFVAFDTDLEIEELYEAEVAFTDYPINTEPGSSTGMEYKQVTLSYKDKVSNNPNGFHKKYEWNRIESAAAFAEKENLTDAARKELKNKKWVLRFFESEYYDGGTHLGVEHKHYTLVDDVTILRLKYETAGVVYDLGVVDNKQTGSREPVNKVEDIGWYLLGIGLAGVLSGAAILIARRV